jgi:hypothetical protein
VYRSCRRLPRARPPRIRQRPTRNNAGGRPLGWPGWDAHAPPLRHTAASHFLVRPVNALPAMVLTWLAATRDKPGPGRTGVEILVASRPLSPYPQTAKAQQRRRPKGLMRNTAVSCFPSAGPWPSRAWTRAVLQRHSAASRFIVRQRGADARCARGPRAEGGGRNFGWLRLGVKRQANPTSHIGSPNTVPRSKRAGASSSARAPCRCCSQQSML